MRGSIWISAALWLASPALASSATGSDLSRAVQAELEELVTTALCAQDSAQRSEAVAAACELAKEEGGELEELLELVRGGPRVAGDPDRPSTLAREEEQLVLYETVLTGFTFEYEGQSFGYAVDVPPNYDPDERVAVLLDPGHGSGSDNDQEGKAGFLGMFRRLADQAGQRDWLVVRTEIIEQVGDGGLRGKLPETEVLPIFDAFFRDLSQRFAVDPDRVYVTGLSQTGFWTWMLGRERADRFAGLAPMAAVTWQVDAWLANFLALPVHALHGDKDEICPVGQARSTCAALERLGAPVLYSEFAGAGHDYDTWRHLPQALERLAEITRQHCPPRISKSAGTLDAPWSYWLRIDELDEQSEGVAKQAPTGGVDAELDGQTIRLYSTGVERLTVALSSEMLALDEDVEILWNGKTVHDGPVESSFATALSIASEKGDWAALFPASVSLEAPRR